MSRDAGAGGSGQHRVEHLLRRGPCTASTASSACRSATSTPAGAAARSSAATAAALAAFGTRSSSSGETR